MPFANFKVSQGTLNAAQKEEIIHKTTDRFAHYFGEGVRPYTIMRRPKAMMRSLLRCKSSWEAKI